MIFKGRRRFERCVSLPVVSMRICDDVFNRHCGVITFHPSCVATVVLWNNRAAPVRIKEDFGRIETHSTPRIERSLNSITVDLSCFHTRDGNVPIVISPIDHGIDRDHTRRPSVINTIKKKEFDPRCMLRVDAKICPIRRNGCSQRRTSPFFGLFCHGMNERLGYFGKSRRCGC